MAVELCQSMIEALACAGGGSQAFLWDALTPGLGVRATPSTKAYVFQSRLDGQAFRMTLTDVSTMTLQAARDEANRMQALVAGGVDPRPQKQLRIIQKPVSRVSIGQSSVMFRQVWNDYIEDRKDSPRRPWSEGYLHNHHRFAQAGGKPRPRSHLLTKPGPIYPLLDRPLEALTSDAIALWLREEAKTRRVPAGQAFRMLRACLRWADEHETYGPLIPERAVTSRRVKDSVPRNRVRYECLELSQLPAFFAACDRMKNQAHAAYFKIILLIGCRPGEAMRMRWDDIDFQWQRMTIRDKVEGTRTIPLTPYVASLLQGIPRWSEWVFTSRTDKTAPMSNPAKPFANLIEDAGLPYMTPHALRRSFATLSEHIEVPAGVVAQIMGHKPSATAEKHYKRRSLDLLRMWHVKIEDFLLAKAWPAL